MDFIEYIRQTFWVPMFVGYMLPYVKLAKDKQATLQTEKDYATYITSCVMFEKLVIYLYFSISLELDNNLFVQSGIILTVLLIISGRLIELVYNYLRLNKRESEFRKNSLVEKDKVFIMGFFTLTCALDVIIIDYKISLLFISLLMGKYFWIDSGLLTLKENFFKIKNDWRSIDKKAKNISFEFAIILIVSDYFGILLKQIMPQIGSYALSSIIGVLVSLICILYYMIKGKK